MWRRDCNEGRAEETSQESTAEVCNGDDAGAQTRNGKKGMYSGCVRRDRRPG